MFRKAKGTHSEPHICSPHTTQFSVPFSHVPLCLSECSLPLRSTNNFFEKKFHLSIRATWPLHLILNHIIILVYLVYSENYKALFHEIFSSFLSHLPSAHLRALFSHTPSLCPLHMTDQFHTNTKQQARS